MAEARAVRLAREEAVENGIETWDGPGEPSLGAGNYGEVTKYTYHGTPVAVKTIRRREGMSHSEIYNLELALGREKGLLEKLRHPNIVNIVANTQEIIVMELFDGSLGRLWSLREMAFVARECTRALAYMQGHEECTFHGDIKPDNILVNRDRQGEISRVVLGDVGIARECSVGDAFVGTPGFMPHPVKGSRGSINSLTDLFGLAVSLLDSFFDERVHADYPPHLVDNTFEFAAKLPPAFEETVSKMLESYKNITLTKTVRIRTYFVRSILDEWDSLLAPGSNVTAARDAVTTTRTLIVTDDNMDMFTTAR